MDDINDYIIGIFMYNQMDGNVPNSFQFFFASIETSMITIYVMQMTFRYPIGD